MVCCVHPSPVCFCVVFPQYKSDSGNDTLKLKRKKHGDDAWFTEKVADGSRYEKVAGVTRLIKDNAG